MYVLILTGLINADKKTSFYAYAEETEAREMFENLKAQIDEITDIPGSYSFEESMREKYAGYIESYITVGGEVILCKAVND